MSGRGPFFGAQPVIGTEIVQVTGSRTIGGPSADTFLTTTQDIANLAFSGGLPGSPFISITAAPYNAIPDGQLAILNVSQGINSNQLTVGLPGGWLSNTVTALGAVVTNAGNSYVCVMAGTTAESGGPVLVTGEGNPIVDNTVWWGYLGAAAVSAAVFQPTDVGKARA